MMRGFSTAERVTLEAVADAAIPPGERLPGGGRPETIDRFQTLLQEMHPRAVDAMRAALLGLDSWSLARHFRRFASLPRDKRERVLSSWAAGGIARRLTLRMLTAPLKLAHFDDPAVFEAVGAPYLPEKATREKARWRSQIITGDDLDAGDTQLEVDVVVVGTGAGGAAVAKELAQKGHAVLMVEEGRFYDRKDFTTRSRVALNRKMFREQGTLTTIGNAVIALPVGRTVGGTTTVNSGTCFRTPDKVLHHWTEDLGLRGLTPDEMAPRFERVERIIGVEEAGWPELGRIAEIIRDGCEALGYDHGPLRRNAEGCDGQGVCCFGCPTDAKRSTNVSYVPLALENNAMCLVRCRVTRIIVQGGRATGVLGQMLLEDGSTRPITVRARHVVLSCGSIYTPLLLSKNRIGNRWDQLGRHLTIHPAFGIGALFDEPVRGWEGIPQGYSIDHFHEDGLMFEGAFVPLEYASIAIPAIGSTFTEAMDAFEHLAIFGFMISDAGTGRVFAGPGGRPIIRYDLQKEDIERIRLGASVLSDVYLAAGARRVYMPITGFETLDTADDVARLRKARISSWDIEMSAYHPLGTARIGSDPRTSVTDGDHESYEVANLYVVDGSSVPSALGVNPQVTIMALATRFAEKLHEKLT